MYRNIDDNRKNKKMWLWISIIIIAAILFLILYRMISLNTDILYLQETTNEAATLDELHDLLRKDVWVEINKDGNDSTV